MGDDRRFAYPPLNLSNDDEAIYVRAELPGVNIEDIELTLSDKTLVLKGERSAPQGKYYRVITSYSIHYTKLYDFLSPHPGNGCGDFFSTGGVDWQKSVPIF